MMEELREKLEQCRDLVARNGITLVRNAEELREAVASMG
jgi:tryptophanyl-tRNA synthetase